MPTLRQKIVRDVATYFGRDAALGLSGWMFPPPREPVVTGNLASLRLQEAVGLYRSQFMGETGLCRIMGEHGSDKGIGRHNYGILYAHLLRDVRDKPLNLFELGIGTNNVRLKSNMGRLGRPGASLYAWREYLPNTRIFAADIDRDILFEDDRIRCFYCDQTSADDIDAVWRDLNDIEFDLIIDDGLHEFHANRLFLECSYRRLRRGGLMVVEDILGEDREKWIEYVASWDAPDATVAFVELPHPYNFVSNNIVCIERH